MRLYFATDVHGSEKCWRKFLNAGKHYSADVIVLGGDMTGKALVPVINDGGGRWHATLLENRAELTTEEEPVAFEHAVGHLPRGGRAGPEGANRHGRRPGDRACREDRLQLPLPAVPLGARRRARVDGRHDAEGRGPGREAGRLDRRAGGDRRAPACA